LLKEVHGADLIGAEGHDGVELGGLLGGIDAKEETDAGGEADT
jgi:hypothetical protein